MTHMKKNFGLSQEEFDKIVADLKKNETHFFEKVFLRHFDTCIGFLRKEYNAHYDDAYDATMDTLIEFRKRLVEGKLKYGNLRFLFTKMATQNYLRNKKLFQTQEIHEKDIEPEDSNSLEEDVALLSTAWIELGESCQELLMNFYYGKMQLAEIATLENKSAAAIRKQKERCVHKIKAILLSKKENI